ncbi:MAG: hypothetical protein V3U88_07500 [Methylococcales bacterium]
MNNSKRFLQLIAILHIIGGLLLPWLVQTPLADDYVLSIMQNFQVNESDSDQLVRFLVGILGPTIASWGVLLLYVVNSFFHQPTMTTWWTIIIAGLIWAPYDSWLSIQHGIYLNAIFNGIVFFCIVVVMLMVRKRLMQKQGNEQ